MNPSTITGNLAFVEVVGVQTFRDRQSSLGPASRNTMSPKIFPCMQRGPNSVAFRTPSHAFAGGGSFQRSAPTGGAAYGTSC